MKVKATTSENATCGCNKSLRMILGDKVQSGQKLAKSKIPEATGTSSVAALQVSTLLLFVHSAMLNLTSILRVTMLPEILM
jgi:hypothetical protein